MDDYESVLFVARDVSVYKVPPRTSLAGYRAQDWGDLSQHLWKGRIRIIETSKSCSIRLEDSQTGEFFAQAPYDHTGTSVDPVLDSSRYFVLRVEDEGKKAFVGIGFPERPEAFDFNVALQDYTKRQKALLNPVAPEEESPSPHIPAGPKKDYSLKEGQTFSISIPGKASSPSSTSSSLLGGTGGSSLSGGTGGSKGLVPLLPPPPGSKKK
ncbi:uncharacterized protein EI90DRAFT_3061485 [Cantharellus anzutake]|uniref:uncharacterized protein n=1 Tax=Cantharellus anzutake TaxID=1750568 RepID=UPI0019044098|nr:uncharacterized protein EI90DRAFT_3061485 [Cantharellus anzutake]KAF8330073.1 hypothetical protein EI90DRAFT_3061485 [Cantharellus anzutake]